MFQNLVKSVSTLVQSAGSAQFPYTIGEEIAECKGGVGNPIWRLLEGTKNGSDEKVTIFAVENRKQLTQNRVDAALNCLNELKRIRHPHVLSCSGDELITDDKIYFACTEYVAFTLFVCPLTCFCGGPLCRLCALLKVYPLSAVINHGKDVHEMNESFVALGLFQIASALSFVHRDLKYSHCAVCPSAIFVNKAGDFKLGSFELAHKKENIPTHFMANFDILATKYRPKELSHGSSNVIDILMKNPIHSMDSWCFGCIIFELFNSIDSLTQRRSEFTKPQQLSNLSAIPHDLQIYYKKLLATKPSSRITLHQVLDSDFITQNSLVQTSTFLQEIAIKSDAEKRQFLQHLDSNIEHYPTAICKHKILPALTHLLQHGFGSNPVILSCVLKISSLFIDDEEEKSKKIRPVVVSMFQNNERGTRINLLKALPKFIDYLDTDTVSKDIFPKVINGFTDSSPVLRECSVRSVLHFAPKLTAALINKQLLPLLDRIQHNDAEPAIRYVFPR